MRIPRLLATTALLCASFTLVLRSQQLPTAITTDPTPNKANPAAMETFQIPSHGAMLNALTYIAAGPGPHPIVILLHGFPGNEKNLDLAQAIRRAGWDVLYFDYRGSWGSSGDFSFIHCMEDTQSAIAYLRDPVNAKRLHADPQQIVLMGHSMGGMVAAWTAAHDPQILALGLISSSIMADLARLPEDLPVEAHKKALAGVAAGLASQGMAPLAGCTPESLAAELTAHAHEWILTNFTPRLTTRPVMVITSDDGGAPPAHTFILALKAAGNQLASEVHIPTDHSYSDHRIALETSVLEFLSSLKK
jgi:uncharacterized protein